MPQVESRPDRYGLIGHPVSHSRSPQIHQLFARQTGEPMTYELIDAAPADFVFAAGAFFAAGGRGLNVTVPHKEAAFALADEVSERGRLAGAVNTLAMVGSVLRADNTDGVGFLRDLTVNHGERVAGARVLVLGAGGAARGIVGPLLAERPSELVVANRTLERAAALVAQLASAGPAEAIAFDGLPARLPFDLVINATSAGLKGDAPPFPGSVVGPKTFCYDLVYSVNDTPFVRWAQALGARRAIQGWGMLIEQAAEAFLIWRGVRPKTAPILKQLAR